MTLSREQRQRVIRDAARTIAIQSQFHELFDHEPYQDDLAIALVQDQAGLSFDAEERVIALAAFKEARR